MILFRTIKHNYTVTDVDDTYNRFAILLQSIESEIVLHRCCRRIWEEADHQVPIFTIHDSIVTTSENVGYVRDVLMQELTFCIGVKPTLAIEEWTMDNLDQNILSPVPTNTTSQNSTYSHHDDIDMSELSSLLDDIS